VPRIYIDDYSARHVSQRIRERIPNATDQARMVDTIKKLLTMNAPSEAVGQYQWLINVERIGRIVLRGHAIRTVYSFSENFPGGTVYKIQGTRRVRA
jgi:hypothetical protein